MGGGGHLSIEHFVKEYYYIERGLPLTFLNCSDFPAGPVSLSACHFTSLPVRLSASLSLVQTSNRINQPGHVEWILTGPQVF